MWESFIELACSIRRAVCLKLLKFNFSSIFPSYQITYFVKQTGATGQESEGDGDAAEEKPAIGFWSGFAWLLGMTLIIALLSEYVVGTIQVTHQTFS